MSRGNYLSHTWEGKGDKRRAIMEGVDEREEEARERDPNHDEAIFERLEKSVFERSYMIYDLTAEDKVNYVKMKFEEFWQLAKDFSNRRNQRQATMKFVRWIQSEVFNFVTKSPENFLLEFNCLTELFIEIQDKLGKIFKVDDNDQLMESNDISTSDGYANIFYSPAYLLYRNACSNPAESASKFKKYKNLTPEEIIREAAEGNKPEAITERWNEAMERIIVELESGEMNEYFEDNVNVICWFKKAFPEFCSNFSDSTKTRLTTTVFKYIYDWRYNVRSADLKILESLANAIGPLEIDTALADGWFRDIFQFVLYDDETAEKDARAMPLNQIFTVLNKLTGSNFSPIVAETLANLVKNYAANPQTLLVKLEKLRSFLTEQKQAMSTNKQFSDYLSPEQREGIMVSLLNILKLDPLYVKEANEILDICGIDQESMARAYPFYNCLCRLQKIQEINSNEANDPWKQEFKPLLAEASSNGLVSIDNKSDLDILVKFIEEYGMLNLPRLLTVFVDCCRAKTFDDLPERTMKVVEDYGIRLKRTNGDWYFSNPAGILNALRIKVGEMKTKLLNNELPPGLESDVGNEQFMRIVGDTRWSRNDSLEQLVEIWKQAIEADPNLGVLPDSYREESFITPTIVKSAEGALPSDDERQKTQIKSILSSQETQEIYGALSLSLHKGASFEADPSYWLNLQKEILHSFTAEIDRLEKTLEMTGAQFDELISAETDVKKKNLLEKQKRAANNERGRSAMQNKILELKKSLKEAEKISFNFSSEADIVAAMDILAGISGSIPFFGTVLRDVSAVHIQRVAPVGWREQIKANFGNDIQINTSSLFVLEALSLQYIKEHYLNDAQDPEHTQHIPFSKNLRLALNRSWQQLPSAKGKLPIESLAERIRKAESPKIAKEGDDITVSMVPIGGMLRIYAGDIGDACYTSQHHSLASGHFPKIHPWAFVTGRETNRPSLRGSMLGIETTSDSGEPVLLARANNPKENFIRNIDADSFVLSTLKAVIETARRLRNARPKDSAPGNKYRRQCVVIPVDRATASSTNRQPVAEVYKKRFSNLQGIGLANEPETNFNGYPVWYKSGGHPCVKIWEIDEGDKETWYGNWS